MPSAEPGLAETILVLLEELHPRRLNLPLTPPQLGVLRWLERMGPVAVSHVAERVGVSASAVTQAAKRLEGLGLVARQRDAVDQRVVWLTLTGLGRTRLAQAAAVQRHRLAELLDRLSAQEQSEMARMCAKMLGERKADADV